MDFWKPSLIYGRNKQNGNCYLEISTIPQSFMWGQSVTVFYMLQFWRNLEMNALSRIHTKTIKFWLNIISIYFYILWNLVQFGLTGKSIWSLWLPFVSYSDMVKMKRIDKMQSQFISGEGGAPFRRILYKPLKIHILMRETYSNKSLKWLSHKGIHRPKHTSLSRLNLCYNHEVNK